MPEMPKPDELDARDAQQKRVYAISVQVGGKTSLLDKSLELTPIRSFNPDVHWHHASQKVARDKARAMDDAHPVTDTTKPEDRRQYTAVEVPLKPKD